MSRFVRYPKPGADGTIRRFEPAYWTVDFPLPMMATVVTTGANSITVNAVFRMSNDLMGLIWATEDRQDHGLYAYPRRINYSGCVLEFDWIASGTLGLDAINGPTLTIEGFDASGAPKSWFVRLWNYRTSGTAFNARIRLDFDNLAGGFSLPADADPVSPSRIVRMFISIMSSSFSTGAPAQIGEQAATVSLNNIDVTGTNSTLPILTTGQPAHALAMTDGFDNAYPFTPERLVEQVHRLGYRGFYVLYMGISKFHSQSWNAGEGRYIVDPAKPILNVPSQVWLDDFFARLHAKGYRIIISVSFEILAQFMPTAWKQRDAAGNEAQTGWQPPSSLTSPTVAAANAYLRDVFLATLARLPAGAEKHVQIGEPWWWDGSYGSGAPYIYDATTEAAYVAATGQAVPTPRLTTVFGQPAAQHAPYLQFCRDQLGVATSYLIAQIKATHPTAVTYLLIFTPQILRSDAPMLRTLNFPQAAWQAPAFDVLQIEDYDKVVEGDFAFTDLTWLLATSILGYAKSAIHYFAGFNLLPTTTWIWFNTDRAIWSAFNEAPAEVFVWSREQVMRDGWLFDAQSWKLYPDTTRLAQCWRIDRTDGVTEAYTSFDMPLVIDGVTFKPANSFSASTLSSDVEMSVADVELLGAIDTDDISAADLLAGVYDHAQVELFVVDWSDLSIPRTIVRRGWIGTISQAGVTFKAELRGLGQRIQQPVIDTFTPECRVDLFSAKCGANRASFAVSASVTALTDGSLGSSSDNRVFFASALTQADGWFAYGELWWTSGANAGRKTEVRAFAGGRIELWEPMGLTVAVGDDFTIHAGCDKAIGTCHAKFANVVNFRGEPNVPGNDAMLKYPDVKA